MNAFGLVERTRCILFMIDDGDPRGEALPARAGAGTQTSKRARLGASQLEVLVSPDDVVGLGRALDAIVRFEDLTTSVGEATGAGPLAGGGDDVVPAPLSQKSTLIRSRLRPTATTR